jgi:hypothetical protein
VIFNSLPKMIVATTVTFLASGMLLGLLIFSLLPDWVAPLAILLLFGATMLAARTKYLFRQRNR